MAGSALDDLIRDRDACYGSLFVRRVRSLGIRDHPTSARSPWQNGYAERLIGSIRRECLDHIVVFGEQHLRHVLLAYMDHYNTVRTHLSLAKDAPIRRPVHAVGGIQPRPVLGGIASSICPDLIYGRDRTSQPPYRLISEADEGGIGLKKASGAKLGNPLPTQGCCDVSFSTPSENDVTI